MPAEAEFDVNDFSTDRSREADKALLVKFFLKPREDSAASRREGRPIFKDTEYIDIKIPGDRSNGICRPATEQDRRRFPEHYRKFKQRVEGTDENTGTPLAEWPLISRSMCEELAFFHVRTVEQLANMADTQVAKFMGLYGIRDKAKLWLQKAKDEKPLWDLQAQLQTRDEKIAELESMIGDLVRIAEGVPDEEGGDLNERQLARKRERVLKAAKERAR